ncbi:MAG TPA: undecaprenyl-diphosphatase UppP [Methylomirabilota bacterium]|jgi:undecaprenyl-diphosphatase
MTALHAAVLGLVQGATEFLPISSSGHLILVPRLLGWPDQGLAFDAAVHLGTVLALLCYFAGELRRLAAGAWNGRPDDRRLAAALALGSVPVGIAGFAFERVIETRLRSTTVVAVSTIVWALVLWLADRHAARGGGVHDLRDVGLTRAVGVGLAQTLALIPGTSRSGITISAGLFAGLDRSTAARFAFLLGLPVTVAAGLLETAQIAADGLTAAMAGELAVGVGTSFLAGLAAISFLVSFLRTRTLLVFVVYRIVLGVLLLWLARGA